MDERTEGTPAPGEDERERELERRIEERREGAPGYDMAEEEAYEPDPSEPGGSG